MSNAILLDWWKILMKDLSFDVNTNTFQQLLQAYDSPHRYYHDSAHLIMCLKLLQEIPTQQLSSTLSTPLFKAEIALALWFHDAIYHTTPVKGIRVNNELESAEWAYTFILNENHDQELAHRVKQCILATKHVGNEDSNEFIATMPWVLDIDLAILGSSPNHYLTFEKQIRQEYAWVEWSAFKTIRLSILKDFLERKILFHTPYFQQRFDALARRNLQNQIHILQKGEGQ